MKTKDNLYQKKCFDLYLWQERSADHFTAQLYSLIHKADRANRESLRLGFPLEVEAWEEWMSCRSPEAFYERHDIIEKDGDTGRWRIK